jgi:hypothetical protein
MWHHVTSRKVFATSCMAMAFLANAQCTASAGEDLHGCVTDAALPVLSIGGAPTAQGGTPPYTYAWSTAPIPLYPGSSIIFHASDLLNDTTVANPVVIDGYFMDQITFRVRITDAAGCTSVDSCRVSFSTFYHHLMHYMWGILQGDSIFLEYGSNVAGGVGPLTYQWQPSHGLSDTTLFTGFWAKPDSSIAYYVTVTDSMGCSSTGSPLYFINVHPVGVADTPAQESIRLAHDQAGDVIRLLRPEGMAITSVQLCNSSGHVVRQRDGKVEAIYLGGLARGVYVLVVATDQGRSSFKVVKE